MATERLLIIVEDQGSARRVQTAINALGPAGTAATNRVKAGMHGVAVSARAAAPQVDYLKHAIAGLGAYMGVRQIVEYADSYINLQNRLRLVTSSHGELEMVMQRLQGVAERTRASLAGTGNMYSRLAVALKTLGVSANETMQVTETLNEAIALSGATTVEALGGMIQLAQGLASGVLRGDELRSVLEQLPAVADVIAARMGVTRGRLRELGEQGAISSKMVFEALKNARTEVHDKFLKTASTIGQAFTVMGNSMMVAVGSFGQMSGASKAITETIKFLAHHLGIVTAALVLAATTAIPIMVRAIQGLTAAMVKNPFFLLGVAIAITVAAVQEMVTEFKRLGGTIEDIKLVFEGPLMAAATFAGSLSGLFNGLVDGIIALFKTMPAAIGDVFYMAMGGAAKAIQWLLDKATDGINSLINRANNLTAWINEKNPFGAPIQAMMPVRKIDLGGVENPYEGALTAHIKAPQQAFMETFDAMLLGMQSKVTDYFKNVRKERDKAILERSQRETDIPGGDAAANPLFGVRALEELQRELDMERSLVGLLGFERQVQEDLGKLKIDLLRQHVDLQSTEAKKALGTAEEQIRALDTLRSKHEILEAVAKGTAAIEAERELIGLYGEERQAMESVLSLKESLRRHSVDMADAEVSRALETARLNALEMEHLRSKQQIYENLLSIDKERELHARFLNELLAEQRITEEQYNRGMRESGQGVNTLSGAAEGLLDPFKRLDTSVAATSNEIGVNLVNSLDRASGAFGEFALSGFRDMDAFRKGLADIFADISKMIAQMIIRMLIMKAIEAGANYLGNLFTTPAASAAGGTALGGSSGGALLGTNYDFMAGGGDPFPGRPTVVGEDGPEIYVPNAGGHVYPNGEGGGATPVVNVKNVVVMDQKDVAAAMVTEEGEKNILQVLGKNKRALKALLS